MGWYYTLVVKWETGWSPEFGSYDKEEVEAEIEDSFPDEKTKILKTVDRHDAIYAAVAALNGGAK